MVFKNKNIIFQKISVTKFSTKKIKRRAFASKVDFQHFSPRLFSGIRFWTFINVQI